MLLGLESAAWRIMGLALGACEVLHSPCEYPHAGGSASLFIYLSLFIYFVRERKHVHQWGRGREGGRERIPSRLCTDQGLGHTRVGSLTL